VVDGLGERPSCKLALLRCSLGRVRKPGGGFRTQSRAEDFLVSCEIKLMVLACCTLQTMRLEDWMIFDMTLSSC
jgi:hypothetical protein